MGPLAFVIFINDLQKELQNTLCVKYVDDSTIASFASDPQDDNMQEAFQEVEKWCENNQMKLNESKTKEILFNLSKKISNVPLIKTSTNQDIERVSETTLLGVTLQNNLPWASHVANMVKKASKRVFFLSQLKRSSVPTKDLLTIYKALIRPVLEYASPVWHCGLNKAQDSELESVQYRCLKIIYGMDKSYEGLLTESQLCSLKERRTIACKKLFLNMQSPQHKLNDLLPTTKRNNHNT